MGEQQTVDQALGFVALRILKSLGVDADSIPPEELQRFGQVDLFGGDAELMGHAIDSLALAEVLVGVEDELGIFLLDETDTESGDGRLLDLVRTVVESVPSARIKTWIDGGDC